MIQIHKLSYIQYWSFGSIVAAWGSVGGRVYSRVIDILRVMNRVANDSVNGINCARVKKKHLILLPSIAFLTYQCNVTIWTVFIKPTSIFHYSEMINNSLYRLLVRSEDGKATLAWGMKHCLSMYTTKMVQFQRALWICKA